MGFMDKAKQLAEQAQQKLDEAQMLAMTVLMEVEALLALGRVDEARRRPRARAARRARAAGPRMILSASPPRCATPAAPRRPTTRSRAAPSSSARRCEEFSELQRGLERARWRPPPRAASPTR